ncbi:hypothetical protein EJ02DRAFT_69419, partial [Clathrospora elynae]
MGLITPFSQIDKATLQANSERFRRTTRIRGQIHKQRKQTELGWKRHKEYQSGTRSRGTIDSHQAPHEWSQNTKRKRKGEHKNPEQRTLEAALHTATLIVLQLLLFSTTFVILPILALLASIATAANMNPAQNPQSNRSSIDTVHPTGPDEGPEASSGYNSNLSTPGVSPDPPLTAGLSINEALLQKLVESITLIADTNRRAAVHERPPFDAKELSFNGDNVTEFLEAI